MRNPNRLIGGVLCFVLVLAFVSWRYEEYRLANPKTSLVTHAAPGAPVKAVLPKSGASSKTPAAILQLGSKKGEASDRSIESFKTWADQYSSATPSERRSLEKGGADLAKLRAGEMEKLLKADPKSFLAAAVPAGVRESFPAAVREYVERGISGMGKLETEYTTWVDGHQTRKYFAAINGERFTVQFAGAPVSEARSGSQPLHGVALGSNAVLSSDPVRVIPQDEVSLLAAQGKLPSKALAPLSGEPVADPAGWVDIGGYYYPLASISDAARVSKQISQLYHPSLQLMDMGVGQTELPPVPAVTTTKGRFKVLVARFRFPEDPSELTTDTDLRTLMEQTIATIREFSYGTVELVPEYTPLLVLPQSRRWYANSSSDTVTALKTDAVSAMTDAGYSVGPGAPYRFVQAFFPRIADANRFPVAGLINSQEGIALEYEPSRIGLLSSFGFFFGLDFANVANASVPLPLPALPQQGVYDVHSVFGMDGFERIGLYEDLAASVVFDREQQDPWDPAGAANANRKDFPTDDSFVGAHFNALNKLQLGWLPSTYARSIVGSATIRLHAFDTPVLSPSNIYVGLIRKDVARVYSMEHRRKILRNERLSRGILLHWGGWAGTGGGTQLIDTTPGSLEGTQDSPLVMGRTFADTVNGIYITPVRDGVDASGEWIEVTVNQGAFSGNRAPTFTLNVSTLTAGPNETVTFSADSVVDLDGDAVSYHWDFGDGSFGDNQSKVSRTFPPGDYVVRVEVSDMKGGITSDFVVVNVGGVPSTRIHGTVIDTEGNPVPNVRIACIGAANYVGFTDSQGEYAITAISTTPATNVAYRFGYQTIPLNFENPASVQAGADGEFNFLAIPLPQVSVSSVNDIDLSRTPSGAIRFTRNGDLSSPLTAKYRLDGDAQPGVHFESPDLTGGVVVFPAGVDQVDVKLTGKSERTGGGQRQLIVSLLMATNQIHFSNSVTNDGTNDTLLTITNSVSVPGWSFDSFDNYPSDRIVASQSDPVYTIGRGESLTRINNPNPPLKPKVSLEVRQDYVAENGSDAVLLAVSIPQALTSPLSINYSVAGTASNGVDFARLSGTVVIPAGRVAVPLSVLAIPDHLIEGNETVIITLEPADALYEIVPTAATGTVIIVDDDLPIVTVAPFRSEAYETYWQTNASDIRTIDGSFRISRSGSVAEPLTVQYLLGGTAENTSDFQTLPGSVVIPAGRSFIDLPIVPLEDGLEEGDESVSLQIASNPTYTAGTPGSARVAIFDGELPVVEVFSDGNAVGEANGAVSFQVLRAGPFANAPLVVHFEVGGSADNGSDYRAVGSTVTIPAGQVSASVSINGIQDFLGESAESVILRLRAGPGYNLGRSISAETVINDADGSAPPVVSFEVAESTVYESTPQLQIGVSLSKAPPRETVPILVEYRVFTGSAALSNDYYFTATNGIGTTGYLAFDYVSPNSDTIWLTTNIDMTILQDDIRERNESVFIALYYPQIITMNLTTNTNPPPVDPGKEFTILTNYTFTPTNFVLSTRRVHKVTIIDDDSSVVSVEAVSPLAYEEGGLPGAFRIRRQSTNGFDQPLKVRFDLSGTASAGTDFVPIQTREVTISAGSDSILIPVTPLDDTVYEGPETVSIYLTGALGAQLDPALSTASITIVDNDGTIAFGQRDYRVSETAGFIDIPVRRTGDLSLLQQVDYSIQPGTAEREFDYSANDGTLTFLPGEGEKAIRISVYNDDLLEAPETVFLSLGNPSGGVALGGQSGAMLTIDSDDSGFIFSTNTFVGAEFSSIPVTVVRVGETGTAGSVRLTTAIGGTNTATAGEDFTAFNQVLSFASGVTTQSVLIVLRDDALLEGDETLGLVLSEPQGGRVEQAASVATGIIRDDECTIDFEVSDVQVYEHDKVARVNVRRQGGLMNAVSIEYRMLDGTAINGTNYTASFGTLQFSAEQSVKTTNTSGEVVVIAGQTNVVLEIPILDDDVAETPKQFTVSVRNPRTVTAGRRPGSAQLGATTNLTVTIIDNDLPGLPDLHFAGSAQVIFSPDTTQSGSNTAVNALAWQPDGRLVVGGEFTSINGFTLNHLGRIDSHGELDLGFNPGLGADGSVLALQATADGKIYVGGTFLEVGGLDRRGLARLNADGRLDTSFDPGLGSGQSAAVRALALEEGGSLLVGGEFVTWDGQARLRLVRLDASGFVVNGFEPRFDGAVRALAVQRDGRILVGGDFKTVIAGSTTNSLKGVARLNVDGSVDPSFNPGAGVAGTVYALAVQPDGHVVVGGEFASVNSVSRTNIARLNANGTVDELSLNGAGANGRVLAVAAHSSGKIYLGGQFTQVDGLPRNYYARLRADGGVDTKFDIGSGADAAVRTLVVAPNSSCFMGGEFSHVNQVPKQRVARILGDEQLSLASLEFVQTALTVDEGDGTAVLAVRRTGSTNVDFTVSYRSVPQLSTATEGVDYEPVIGSLHFAPGVLTNQIVVRIIDDNLAEKTETIAVELTDPPVGIDIGAQSGAVISIEDNESSVALSSATYTGSESSGSALITLVRQGSVNFAASVTLETADGTALAGLDYTSVSSKVDFAVNETVRTVQIPILEDRLQEGSEQFLVRLISPVGLLLGSAAASVTISDNDVDRIVLVGSALTQEANGNGTIDPGETVTLSVALRNAGTADTTNLVATLVSASNVVSLATPQTYGFMAGEGSPISRSFQFRNTASAGGSLTLTFQLSDGGRDLGQVSTQVSLGAQTRTFSSSTPIVINDDGPASPYPSTINVSGLSGTPLKVTVKLDGLTHGALSDVDIMLVAPNGERSIILSDIGGNRAVSGLVLTLDDEAAAQLPTDAAPVSGTYRPRNSLVLDLFPAPAPLPNQQATKQDLNFKNIDPNGAWSLYVLDDTADSQGQIKNGWSISIVTSGVLLSVNDLGIALSESSDPVVLGQNLTYTLRVSNSGPGNATNAEVRQVLPAGVTFVSASAGATTNALGEVRATIASLAVGASAEYRVVVKPNAIGTLTSSAFVSSPLPDAYLANNTASITTTVAETAGSVELVVARQGDLINISWPASARGTLQAADAFAEPQWKAVEGVPTLQSDRMNLTVPASNSLRFYRLHQP